MNSSVSYFSIEGLVGAGKSSLIKCLPTLLEPEGCKIVSEPVHLYTSFMEGLYNPLEELQMDPIQSVVAGQSHIIQLARCYYDGVWSFIGMSTYRGVWAEYLFTLCICRDSFQEEIYVCFFKGLLE